MNRKHLRRKIQLVTQEHTMGCGVACVASVLATTYKEALLLFKKPQNAWIRGYFCKDLVGALNRAGIRYSFKYIKYRRDPILRRAGTIVFTQFSPRYPRGHYLVRASKGWMNPWVNFPTILPAKSAWVSRLPSPPT